MEEQRKFFKELFISISDPRIERKKLHNLSDILVIALIGMLAGCESFTEFEDFGEIHEEFFQALLGFENGIPSHDTFARVFSVIDRKQFDNLISGIVSHLKHKTPSDGIAIDGKTVRRSYDRLKEQNPLHLVSAYQD